MQRPAEIVNYDSMGAAPALLAGVLVLAAVVSLGLTLASGVGRRRDLSILAVANLVAAVPARLAGHTPWRRSCGRSRQLASADARTVWEVT